MSEVVSYKIIAQDMLSGKLSKLSSKGNAAFGRLDKGQRKMQNELDRSSRKVNNLGGRFRWLKGIATTFIGGMAARSFFRLGAEMESTRIAFQTLIQDVEKGNKLFKDINSMANLTPFNNRVLQDSAKTMLSFNIGLERIMPNLQNLGDIAMGDAEKMKMLTLAFAQSQSAGRLMGQDLLQMINAGFNPLQVISEKTGRSMADLKDEMSKGAISAQMVEDAFRDATQEGGKFYKMMERQSQTMGGLWSTLVGKFQFFIGKLSSSQSKLFGDLLRRAIGVVDVLLNNVENMTRSLDRMFGWLQRNAETIKFFASAVLGVAGAFATYKVSLWAATIATKAYRLAQFAAIATTRSWAVAQRALNMTMRANPIGLIVTAIGALVGGVIYAWKRFEGFRGVVYGLWEVLKLGAVFIYDWFISPWVEGVKLIYTAVKSIYNVINDNLFKPLARIFRNLWDNTLKPILNNIWGAIKSIVEPIVNLWDKVFGGSAQRVANAFSGAYRKETMSGSAFAEQAKRNNGSNLEPSDNAAQSSITDNAEAGGASLGANTAEQISTVTGGGKQTKNINISIDSLIEQFSINTTNIQEGIDDLQDKVKEVLLQAVNDVNIAAQ